MEWFRFYDEVLDDPKVQRLPAALFRDWINILCLCNRNDPRGVLPSIDDVAFGLRISTTKAKNTVKKLHEADLLVTEEGVTYPNGWHKRQRVSDDGAKRVAEHRARKAASNVTGNEKSNVTSDTPETLPHARATDTEQKQSRTEAELTPKPPKAKTPKPKPADDTAPNGTEGGEHPFALFEAMCEPMGVEVAEVPERDKRKQLAVAKRLAGSGMSSGDVARMTRWLKSQQWRTSGVDLFVVEKEQMRWISEGKPDGAKPVPTGDSGQADDGKIRSIDELFAYGENNEPTRNQESNDDFVSGMAEGSPFAGDDSVLDASSPGPGFRAIAGGRR